MAMSKEAQEIGQRIYERMGQILSIAEDERRKVTGTLLDSVDLGDLQIIVENQAALDVLIGRTHKAYNCHLEGKEEETPAQVVAAALAVVAAAQAAAAPPAKAPSPQHKQRQHQQRQRKPDQTEFPPLGGNAERTKGPAAAQAAAPPAHHQGSQRRKRPAAAPAGLRRAVATVAAAMSTVALATATVFTDPKVLLVYLDSTLQGLWDHTKNVWFKDCLYKRVVRPFYGTLWMTCPPVDADKFLLFSQKKGHVYTEDEINLKENYTSFVVVIAYHCILNVIGLRFLKIRCMFDDEGKIVDEFYRFIMNVIKGYIAKYSNSSIIDNFDECVEYICSHDNVRKSGFKNSDPIIKVHIAAVKSLFAEATKDAAGATIDEMRDYMAKINGTVAEMKTKLEKMEKTQEQTARRLGEVHAEVVVLRKKVDEVADAADETVAMLAQWGIGSSTEGR